MLKIVLNKCCKYSVVEKYKDIVVNEQTELQTWNNLWLLKNPIFRAARLKILYGDIFCNEKRHRFGLTESSDCVICGETETKEHQLFYCRNAIRCWEVLDLVRPQSFTLCIFLASATLELYNTIEDHLGTNIVHRLGTAIAQWIRLCLPSCCPGFESQAKYLFFIFVVL